MKGVWQKGGFTIEAAIWVPVMIFLIMNVVQLGIHFFEESINREISVRLQKINIVQEFYNYQILGEIGEEILDD